MTFRTTFGIAAASAAGILALTAGTALAAGPSTTPTPTPTPTSGPTSPPTTPPTTPPPARIATHLTLKSSTTNAKAGTWITLTAHLDKHGTNRTVVIDAQAKGPGDKPFVVGKGAVDKHGNVTVKYRSYQNHSFWATFGGGTSYAPSTSAKHTVSAYAAISATLHAWYTSYKWAGHTVHKVHSKSIPYVTGTVSPAKPNGKITMHAQYYSKGKWLAANAAQAFSLNAGSEYGVEFTKWPKGYIFRVQATFKGDVRDHAGAAAWTYWTVTS